MVFYDTTPLGLLMGKTPKKRKPKNRTKLQRKEQLKKIRDDRDQQLQKRR